MTNVIRVGIAPWQRLNLFCLDENVNERCYPGLELEVLRTIAVLLNVSLRFVLTNQQGCGQTDANLTTDKSLIAMLARDEIDIIGNLCTLTPTRSAMFQPSYPVLVEALGFLVKAPGLSHTSFMPLASFQECIWYATVGVFVLFHVTATLTKMVNDGKKLIDAVRESFDDIICHILQFRAHANSFSWVCLMAFFALLTTMYSSYIRNVLMNPERVEQPFTDENSFLDQLTTGRYKLADYQPKHLVAVHGLSRKNTLRLKEIIDTVGYFRVKDSSKFQNSIIENENLVIAKNMINIMDYIERWNESHKLWKVPVQQTVQHVMCYFWKRDFPFADQFNEALTYMRIFIENEVSRLYGQIQSGIHKGTSITLVTHPSSFRQFSAFQLPFFGYLSILLFSCFVLLVEIIVYRQMHQSVTVSNINSIALPELPT